METFNALKELLNIWVAQTDRSALVQFNSVLAGSFAIFVGFITRKISASEVLAEKKISESFKTIQYNIWLQRSKELHYFLRDLSFTFVLFVGAGFSCALSKVTGVFFTIFAFAWLLNVVYHNIVVFTYPYLPYKCKVRS